MSIDILEILALAAGLVLFAVLYFLAKKEIDFGIRTILALVLGGILGIIFRDKVTYITVFGRIYTRLISAVVIPLLLVSVINSVSALKDTTRLKSIGFKSVGWLTGNTLIASLLTIPIAFLFRVGLNADVTLPTDYEPKEVPGLSEVITNFFPSNIVSEMADGNIIPIIIVALAIGIAILVLGEKNADSVKPFKDFIDSSSKIVFWIIEKIIDFTPYAVLALIANAVGSNGAENLRPLLWVLIAAYIACAIQTFIVNGALLRVFGKVNPVTFFKKYWPAQVVAFTSQSSAGTLPVSLKCLINDLGVSPSIANFTAPLGATVGMPGCAGIWPTLLGIFAVRSLGIEYSATQYIILVLLTVVVSLGTAGVPGTATITATAVFAAAGLPIEIIVILSPISSIVDMARTATNVTSAAVSSVIVAQQEGELDAEAYAQPKEKVLKSLSAKG